MGAQRPRFQLLLISACAVAASAGPCRAQVEPWDPWEPANRKFYALHQVIDRFVLSPVANAYGHLPKPLRRGLRNFARNLGEPAVAVNDLLQGRPKTAAGVVGRFTINSTVGVGGILDVAKRTGLPHHDNDFGTTLGRWGAQPGPYMFLPLLGPSDLRDTVGGAVNIFLSPFTWVQYDGRTTVAAVTTLENGIDKRYEARQALETVRETSTDPYATLRSFFQQSREAAIHGSNAVTLPDFETPDMQSEPGPQAAPQNVPELPDIQSEPEPSAPATQAQPEAPPAAQPEPSAPAAGTAPPEPPKPAPAPAP